MGWGSGEGWGGGGQGRGGTPGVMGRTWPRSRSARSESVSARKGGPSGRALSTLGGRFLHADDQRVHASATSDSCDAPAARRSASSPSQPWGEGGG